MAKVEDLVDRKYDNVFDTNRNVLLQYPKKDVPLKGPETIFTTVRLVKPSVNCIKIVAQLISKIILFLLYEKLYNILTLSRLWFV